MLRVLGHQRPDSCGWLLHQPQPVLGPSHCEQTPGLQQFHRWRSGGALDDVGWSTGWRRVGSHDTADFCAAGTIDSQQGEGELGLAAKRHWLWRGEPEQDGGPEGSSGGGGRHRLVVLCRLWRCNAEWCRHTRQEDCHRYVFRFGRHGECLFYSPSFWWPTEPCRDLVAGLRPSRPCATGRGQFGSAISGQRDWCSSPSGYRAL
mmetsp:Transcript_104502/g.248693  ORF Transcript_104502/g.248693 Transcript_104502/m.248693 type:complete len:204 (-) Transcript_104502:575-1186(-)